MSDLLNQLATDRLASRIWQRDTAAFTRPGSAPAVHDAIRNRLGWLDAPEAAASQIGVLEAFAGDVRAGGVTQVYLLGMGGSSLCAEVLRDVPAARSAGLALTVLDTTDERAIREAADALDPARTLFWWRARAARRSKCRRSSGISGRR